MISSAGRLLVVALLLRPFGLEGVDSLTAGSRPSPRYSTGFAATPDGMFYVFGGQDGSGGNEGVDGAENTPILRVGGGGRSAAVDWAGFVGRRHAACTCRTAAFPLSLSRPSDGLHEDER
jgi:hypothetical protein